MRRAAISARIAAESAGEARVTAPAAGFRGRLRAGLPGALFFALLRQRLMGDLLGVGLLHHRCRPDRPVDLDQPRGLPGPSIGVDLPCAILE
jgi:hypothetical protein